MTIPSDIHAGVALDVAAMKEHIRRMVESAAPITAKELRIESARRIKRLFSGFQNHGTPSRKLAHRNGRHRTRTELGVLHATKGYHGGKKHSRRSNRT